MDGLLASFHYQACSNAICLRPTKDDFLWGGAKAAGPGVKANSKKEQTSGMKAEQASAASGGANPEWSFSDWLEKGAFFAFLALFVAGLALNLTLAFIP